MSDPEASVIIKTRNRAGMLEDCLESVLNDRSAIDREIIVVDNASTDGTRALVEDLVRSDPRLLYVWEPGIGNARALNAGVAKARGELLFFTDDDVIV